MEEDETPLSGFRREIDTLHREMDRLFEDLFHERMRFPFMKEIGPVSEEAQKKVKHIDIKAA